MQGLVSNPSSVIQSFFLSRRSIQFWKEIVQAVGPLGVIHVLHAVISSSQEIVQYCLRGGSIQQGFQLECDVCVQA